MVNETLKTLMTDYCFTVLYENIEVAHVSITEQRKNVKIEKIIPDGMIQPFGGNKLDLERVYCFLKDRCYEDGYADLENVLAAVGMTQNNPYEWNRISHGRTTEDHFWIRFDGEDVTWEELLDFRAKQLRERMKKIEQ